MKLSKWFIGQITVLSIFTLFSYLLMGISQEEMLKYREIYSVFIVICISLMVYFTWKRINQKLNK